MGPGENNHPPLIQNARRVTPTHCTLLDCLVSRLGTGMPVHYKTGGSLTRTRPHQQFIQPYISQTVRQRLWQGHALSRHPNNCLNPLPYSCLSYNTKISTAYYLMSYLGNASVICHLIVRNMIRTPSWRMYIFSIQNAINMSHCYYIFSLI
jgi:hypothetical protein